MKKLICTLLCLITLLCLFAACGRPSSGETTGPAKTTATTKPTETTKPNSTTKPTETTKPEESTKPEETAGTPDPVKSIGDMPLMDILEKIYEICDDSADDYYNISLDSENLSRYFGTDFAFTDAIASEYQMGGGYSLCFVRVEAGKTEEVAALIEKYADPDKWVCMSAEKKVVAVNGNVVMLCMASSEVCQKIETAFKNLK